MKHFFLVIFFIIAGGSLIFSQENEKRSRNKAKSQQEQTGKQIPASFEEEEIITQEKEICEKVSEGSQLRIEGKTTFCAGSSTELKVISDLPASNYCWSNGADGAAANFSSEGIVTVTMTDPSTGCVDSASITLVGISPPEVTITSNTGNVICEGESSTLTANAIGGVGVLTYSWSSNSVTNQFTTTASGLYSVKVTDVFGCAASASFNLNAAPKPNAKFTVSQLSDSDSLFGTFMFKDETELEGAGKITFRKWNFNSGLTSDSSSAVFQIKNLGWYNVTLAVESDQGCPDTATLYFRRDGVVYASCILSPNDDGSNDKLYFKGLENYPNNKIVIYSSSGEKIYEITNYENDWDGRGEKEGTYYYILEVPNARPQTTFASYFKIIR